jgi:hypothetical protein
MGFFDDLKEKLKDKLTDFSTIEHVLIIEESNEFIYRFQQTAGDSLTHVGNDPIDPEYFSLFNQTFSASVEARTSLTKFIIECLT